MILNLRQQCTFLSESGINAYELRSCNLNQIPANSDLHYVYRTNQHLNIIKIKT